MAADAQSLNIDLDMVAVSSDDRKVLDLARALLLSQAARVAVLEAAARVKPIADAPRDGTHITVLCPVIAKWSVKLKMWWTEMPSVLHPEYYVASDQSGEGRDGT